MRRALIGVCLWACARSASAPSQPQGEADAGTISDAGVGTMPDPGAAAADAGIVATADAGASADAGGTTPPDAGTTASVDAGIGPESWCGSSGPGPLTEAEPGLATDCSSLQPDGPGTPLSVETEDGMGWGCHGATSDLVGDVALETWTHDSSSGWPAEVDSGFVMKDGTPSSFRGGGAPLLPLSEGFVGRVPHWPADFPPTTFVAFSTAPFTPRVVNLEVALAADPRAGTLAIDEPWNVDAFWLTAHRFDAKGQLVAAPADVVEGARDQGPRYFAAGLAHDGWGVVVFSGEPQGDPQNLYARWIDPSGRGSGEIVATGVPVGDTQREPPFDSWSKLWLRPLFDGSLILRVDGKWKARLTRTTGSAGPAPDWLSGPDYRDIVPLSQGYAVVGPVGDGDCRTVVELRAPAGNLCATRALRDVVHADVGADGTLIVMYSHPGSKCGWRWWPALIQ